ncbi:MAG: hypothetical protein DMG63_05870 [Acidobacteria bacterium]|nr:MAG: hypothetical protein DMG63_05870 [Acidobacteriota bacterium]
MRSSRVPAFLFGLIVGLIVVPISTYCYFRFGLAPVATGAAAMPFEKTFARMGLHARMDREYPRNAPVQVNDGNNLAGAYIYREHCAVCHGAEGPHPSSVPKGMRINCCPDWLWELLGILFVTCLFRIRTSEQKHSLSLF